MLPYLFDILFPDTSPAFLTLGLDHKKKVKSRPGRKNRVLFAAVNQVAWLFRP